MSLAGYAPQKPHFEILEVLASIAAYQDSKFVPGKGKRWGRAGAWCIVRQGVIRGWYERLLKRYERSAAVLCRRTLQYHLAALRRSGHLRSQQRHVGEYELDGRGRTRSRKLVLRPSLYELTTRGRLWVSRHAAWVENPAALLAAQKIAQSGFNPVLNSSTSLSRAVDKAPTAPGGKTAALRARARSTIASSAPRRQKGAGQKGPARLATKRQARRKSPGGGRTAKPRRRRP